MRDMDTRNSSSMLQEMFQLLALKWLLCDEKIYLNSVPMKLEEEEQGVLLHQCFSTCHLRQST
jgi:hypothetical protein